MRQSVDDVDYIGTDEVAEAETFCLSIFPFNTASLVHFVIRLLDEPPYHSEQERL